MKQRLYDGSEFEHAGLTFRVKFEHDQDSGPPWENGDGRGIVGDWETRANKRPGDRVLCTDRHSVRYFDFAGTIAKAKRECWGLNETETAKLARKLGRVPTRGEIRAESVEREYEYLRLWCNDQWSYVGVIVVMLDDEGEETQYQDSIWGVETIGDYHIDVAHELAAGLAEMRQRERNERAAYLRRERAEKRHWEYRDTVTR